jgi:uncharacterized protein with GYD domain
MARYLIHGSYNREGLEGLLKEGGTGRRQAVQNVADAFGGKVEAVYYAFGEDDFFLVLELPDNVSAAAVSLATNAAGAVKATVTVLMTPEEVDEAVALAAAKGASYRPPGR